MIRKFLTRLPTSSRMQVRSYNAAPECRPRILPVQVGPRSRKSTGCTARPVPPIALTRPVASPTLNNREPVQPRTRRAVFIAAPGTETLDLVGPLQVFSLGLCSRQSAPSLQTGGCIAAGEGQRQPLQTRQRVPQFGQACRQVRIAILDY